jgi:hypothetical protein
MRFDDFKNLLGQPILTQQEAGGQIRRLIRDHVTNQFTARKAADCGHLDHAFLHFWIADMVAMKQQVDPQLRSQWLGLAVTFVGPLRAVVLK